MGPVGKGTIVMLALMLAGCGNDRRAERLREAGPNPSFQALMRVADADAGSRRFSQCAECHKIRKDGSANGGPNLYGVYGRPVAAVAGFPYSGALKQAGGTWDAARLDAWLANPQRLVPGTVMGFAGVPDPLDRADLIAYLRQQSDRAP